jgi:HlyD family secretion protein
LPTTMAEGQVVPNQQANLAFARPGIIETVSVKEGELVQKGQVIARLKGQTSAEAAIAQAELQVLSAQQALDDLNEKASLGSTDAELKLAQARIELKNALDARESLDYQKVTQNNLDLMRANYIIAQDAFKTASDDYDQVKDRADNDLIKANALSKLSAARLARDNALYNLNKALERPEANKVAEADARVAKAQAAMDDAQATYAKVKNGPDPEKLALAQASLNSAQAQLDAARTALSDLELKAPFTGTLVSSDLEVGQAVGSQTQILLGDISNWKIETTDLTEQDIAGLQAGMPVSISFDAIPDLKLAGKVDRIKPLGENKQGDITYTVHILLDEQDPRLLWNMKSFITFEGR